MDQSTVSVIIVSWNTEALLYRCLESLAPALKLARYEVIVVDNGSQDGSPDMVMQHFPQVRLICNDENRGFTRAVNQGYQLARGEFVLLLNSDTVVSLESLDASVSYLEDNPEMAVVGCNLTFPDGGYQSCCFRFASLWGVFLNVTYLSRVFPNNPVLNWDRYGHPRWTTPHQVECVMGSFMMIRSEAVPTCTLLDEGYFMYGEEVDLCYRLQKAGWGIAFNPAITVVHHHGGSLKSPSAEAWAYLAKHRANLRFLAKWRGLTTAYLANGMMLAGLIPRSAAWILTDFVGIVRSRFCYGWRKTRKLSSLRFHLTALVRPSLLLREWGPPR